MTFAANFRTIVGPRLRAQCRFRGLMIALGDDRLTDAAAEIMGYAARMGAVHLPPDVLEKLPDQIAEWLLEAVDEALPLVEAQERLATRVAVDIERWGGDHVS